MELSKSFKELLNCFETRHVRFMVVGGYATSVYGVPRYTKDLDVWVEVSPANAEAIILALDDFGFGGIGLDVNDFLKPDIIVQLGYEPNRVDILTSLKALEFADCYPRRLEAQLDGITIPLLAADDLVANKSAVGRIRDLADIEDILRRQFGRDEPTE